METKIPIVRWAFSCNCHLYHPQIAFYDQTHGARQKLKVRIDVFKYNEIDKFNNLADQKIIF